MHNFETVKLIEEFKDEANHLKLDQEVQKSVKTMNEIS
jgi:hypothetical protein